MSKVNVEKFLELEQDLRRYRKALAQAREVMLDQEITEFPIFILHQQQLSMGVPVIEAGETTGQWSVHASSLEEFVLKNIILEDKVAEFKNFISVMSIISAFLYFQNWALRLFFSLKRRPCINLMEHSIDLGYLKQISFGDPQLLADMLDEWIQDTRERLNKLTDTAHMADPKAAFTQVHNLKTSFL
ncbi:MAG: hypothetical protein U0T81_19610 [Saprospiraceae bacterium]